MSLQAFEERFPDYEACAEHLSGLRFPRPEVRELADGEDGLAKARSELMQQLGEHVLAHMTMENGTEFVAKLERPPDAPTESELEFRVAPERIHVFDRETGVRKA